MANSMRIALAAAAVLVISVAAAPVRAADMPAVSLADVKAEHLDKNWSDVKTEGEVRYREAAAGARAMVKLPVWWADAKLRPDENTQYVLEVRYKDTAKTPVIAYAHGAIGGYYSPSEVHRFGGTGDGAWKTATVAVGWDQLIRYLDAANKGLTAVGFKSDEALPIASIKVRAAAPADAEQWNAQTRDWVARAQAVKRKAAATQAASTPTSAPAFLADGKHGPVVAFGWSTLVPLLQTAAPKEELLAKPIKIRMCLNELEGGSFGVYASGKELTNVNYTVGELTGEAGKPAINSSGLLAGKLAADVIPRTAEYALVQSGRALKWYPQRLWPAYAVTIPAGRSHWFVFNLRSHRGTTKPGLYKGSVSITCDQGKVSLPVEVEVLNVDLLTMDEAKLFMGGCVTGLLPVHDIAFQADYNQNGINLWYAGVNPGMKIENDKLVLDFTILDEWMAQAAKRGLKGNVWFMGGDPANFPRTMSIYREMAMLDTRGGAKPPSQAEWVKQMSSPEGRATPPEKARELVREWIKQVTEHARQANWPEVILTPFDEPAKWAQPPTKPPDGGAGQGPWIRAWFKETCKDIHAISPGTRIYGSIHHINLRGPEHGMTFLESVDVFCTNAMHEDPQIGDKVRAAGKTLWQYSGGDVPDQARFGFGFYFASYGSVGSLKWAYNWGAGYDTTEGANWIYGWQTPFDTIPAPSFEGMREAWDDRRVIETYRKAFANDAEALADLDKLLKEARSSRGASGRDTVSDFYTAIDDVGKLDRWRNRLLDRLVAKK